jgi:hypothetical protein
VSAAALDAGQGVRRDEVLRLALRAVAVVFAFEAAVSGQYGLAPQPLYWFLLAGDPPVVAGVAVACWAARGNTRAWLGVALAAFCVLATIAFGDFIAARAPHLTALAPLRTKASWNVAALANVTGFYGTLFAARLLPQRPLHHTVGRLAVAVLGAVTIGFVITRWIHPVPPLVPFFNACLFLVPAAYLFEVTEAPFDAAEAER